MRPTRNIILLGILAAFILTGAALAQDEKMAEAMAEMGPPKEIQEAKYLVGTWDVAMSFKWDPADTIWQDSKGTATYEYIAGGACIMMTYEAEMMGMQFLGNMLMAYNNQTKKWASCWTDNMGGLLSYYEGTKTGDKTVLSGEDTWEGMTYVSRITTYNETPTRFDWKIENSFDGGKNWVETGKAVYTKQK